MTKTLKIKVENFEYSMIKDFVEDYKKKGLSTGELAMIGEIVVNGKEE